MCLAAASPDCTSCERNLYLYLETVADDSVHELQEEYDLDEEMRQASKRKRASKKAAADETKEVALDADITPEEMQMMQAMGIPFVSSRYILLQSFVQGTPVK